MDIVDTLLGHSSGLLIMVVFVVILYVIVGIVANRDRDNGEQ